MATRRAALERASKGARGGAGNSDPRPCGQGGAHYGFGWALWRQASRTSILLVQPVDSPLCSCAIRATDLCALTAPGHAGGAVPTASAWTRTLPTFCSVEEATRDAGPEVAVAWQQARACSTEGDSLALVHSAALAGRQVRQASRPPLPRRYKPVPLAASRGPAQGRHHHGHG